MRLGFTRDPRKIGPSFFDISEIINESSNLTLAKQITDKAFCIATPMLKAFWTKRFAARWRDAPHCECFWRGVCERLRRVGKRFAVGNGCGWAQCMRCYVKLPAERVHRMCQTGRPLRLRYAVRRIVA